MAPAIARSLIPDRHNRIALAFMEAVGNAISGSERPEIDVRRQDNLKSRIASNVVSDVEQAVSESDFRPLFNKEHGIEATHTLTPDWQFAKPEQSSRVSLNGSLRNTGHKFINRINALVAPMPAHTACRRGSIAPELTTRRLPAIRAEN